MAAIRSLVVLAFVLGSVLVALSPRRRARLARKLAQSRAFSSRRVVDRDGRRDQDRWDDDGGATIGETYAAVR